MGHFRIGLLKRHLGCYGECIVETGTYKAAGARVMKDYFRNVYTIELDPQLYSSAVGAMVPYSNVHCLFGDSVNVLRTIVPKLPYKSIVFFLDAHWSGDSTVDWDNSEFKSDVNTSYRGSVPSSENQVPLLEELSIIHEFCRQPCLIYIDDMDKFDDKGCGTKDLKFVGEDWSHLSVQKLRDTVKPRLFNFYFPVKGQLIIELRAKSG